MGNNLSARTMARIHRVIAKEIRPGEVAIVHACSSMMICGCIDHNMLAEPCTMVGRTKDVGHDRCLVCWTIQRRRDYAWQPTELILFGPASRGAPQEIE